MARMSIDDMVARDTRIDRLAKLCGWSRRETRACLEDVWAVCYDRVVPYLDPEDIEVTAARDAISPPPSDGFVAALRKVGLARDATAADRVHVRKDGTKVPWPDQIWRDRVYLSGAAERVGYLLTKRSAGSEGGVKSGESRRSKTKHSFASASSESQARGNPSSSVPDPSSASAPDRVPDQEREDPDAPVEPAPPQPGFQLAEQPAKRPRRGKADFACSEPEKASALRVLGKLGERNGTAYTGCESHLRLIVGRMREGRSELDLRKVIAYCAEGLKWEGDAKMHAYLTPETLFGPQTISKYLDPARSWAAREYPEDGASGAPRHRSMPTLAREPRGDPPGPLDFAAVLRAADGKGGGS